MKNVKNLSIFSLLLITSIIFSSFIVRHSSEIPKIKTKTSMGTMSITDVCFDGNYVTVKWNYDSPNCGFEVYAGFLAPTIASNSPVWSYTTAYETTMYSPYFAPDAVVEIKVTETCSSSSSPDQYFEYNTTPNTCF